MKSDDLMWASSWARWDELTMQWLSIYRKSWSPMQKLIWFVDWKRQYWSVAPVSLSQSTSSPVMASNPSTVQQAFCIIPLSVIPEFLTSFSLLNSRVLIYRIKNQIINSIRSRLRLYTSIILEWHLLVAK